MKVYLHMDKKIICFFPGDLNPGGIAHLMINLAHDFISRGIEVHFFLTKRRGEIEGELPAGVKIYRGGTSIKNCLFPLMGYIRTVKPYAVISARDSLNAVNVIACTLTGRATKAITSVHVDFSSDNQTHKLKGRLHRYGGYLLGILLYRFSDEIIAVSKGVAENLAERAFISQKRVTVIYNPTYKESDQSSAKALSFMDAFPSPKFIGVGRLTEQKGFDTLIKAFFLYREKYNKGTLIILGEGEDRATLESLIRRLNLVGCVHMPGYMENPSAFIKHADVFVFSSRWEGFGNVLVEALGVGAKIVSTDCKSGPAEILDNGRFGSLVPVDDISQLADAMERQLSLPNDEKLLLARAKDFAIDKIANEYLHLIFKTEPCDDQV